MSDAMNMKSLQPGYRSNQRRQRKALVDAALHLASVVRENIPHRGKRYAVPTNQTMKMDRIRDALARIDALRQGDGKHVCTPADIDAARRAMK